MFGINSLKKINSDLAASNSHLIESVKALQTFNTSNAIQNIRTMIFPNWQSVKEIDSYIIFDDVYSVVSRLATSSAQVDIKCYNDNTNEDLPPTDNMVQYIKTLTLEEKEIMYTWLYLTGEVFMFKDRLLFGPNKGRLKTYFMHPAFMTVILADIFPNQVIGFRYQDTQTTFTLDATEVIYAKYFNPTTRYNERHRGMSPIKAMAQRLTRLQANMSTTVSQMQNGGNPIWAFNKTAGVEVTNLGQFKDDYSRFSRNPDNKGAPFIIGGEWGILDLGLSTVELDAIAQADVDFDKICNAFSISSVLFNNKKASTESNVKEMRKDMYTNAILPNVTRMCNAITFGAMDIFGEGKCCKADTSKIPEMQENMKEKADGWAALPAFVPNEMRISMGQDELADPLADKLYVKQGYTAIEDLNIDIQPIPNNANDYNNP